MARRRRRGARKYARKRKHLKLEKGLGGKYGVNSILSRLDPFKMKLNKLKR